MWKVGDEVAATPGEQASQGSSADVCVHFLARTVSHGHSWPQGMREGEVLVFRDSVGEGGKERGNVC